MTPFVQDADFTLYLGDVRECLRYLRAESVHTVVTSPPYWGLRDYGTGSWEGGDPDCDHAVTLATTRGGPKSTLSSVGAREVQNANTTQTHAQQFRDVCGKCGATRVDQQLGLEPTPEAFVAAMVDVFRDVHRVLREDGTLWLNLGDSYATGAGRNDTDPANLARRAAAYGTGGGVGTGPREFRSMAHPTKPKDLVGIPWRVAFALQADGWYLRSDIIWSKPNPMPESVTDRPTKAHEYVFLMTKSPRYFFDADAIAERAATPPGPTWDQRKAAGATAGNMIVGHDQRNGTQRVVHGDGSAGRNLTRQDGRRNVRSVWEIATQPYPEAHFATFPEALPERCIKAGTSERGCCPECGAPWEREVERTPMVIPERTAVKGAGSEETSMVNDGARRRAMNGQEWAKSASVKTLGWRPGCGHYEDAGGQLRPEPFIHHAATPIVPCTVLDPFMGSGTTALVARRLGRRSVGVELNPEYAALCARRLQQLSLEFA